ncbi:MULTISPECIES: DUF2093 domain-containing protein [unclassified Novosphingobium]|uniref:DUF2093 domain-containing protein n=1 Tax=Novosphingobium pentaromativorans TaxID=205844 RepID=A0A2W5QE00_9SPHN|nr:MULTISPECIES: DUF2093 domain-containing protein [Novosphingobium]PZQ52963.1 MAG: DUF2093 domain-containing protein [Novosphingobium pentaromativorans]GFE75931.1 hypothetical protein NTCA1_35800 [Novosphingobium sp. TCA1]
MLMSSADRPAKLAYGPNGFRVLSGGQFVLCAVTGEKIPLEELRYWSAEFQEPYASAEIATKRLTGKA